jgi:hypothetical protein
MLATAPTAASTSICLSVYRLSFTRGRLPASRRTHVERRVWAVANTNPEVLYAFDATNLVELYDSTQAAAGRDSFGGQ